MKAALLLHGFTGDPWEVAPLAEGLRADGFAVEAPRLPGHDGRPESLEVSTWREWYEAARDAFDRLAARGGAVCVAGLSMGALLALHLAAEKGAALPALALLSTPLRLVGRPRVYGWALRCVGVYERWRYSRKGPRDVLDPAVLASSPHTPLVPARAFVEFDRLRRVVRGELGRVAVPTLVLHARHDHTAWPGSLEVLRRSLKGPVETLRLERSYHLMTVDVEKATVIAAVRAFFGRHVEAAA